jgi:hypothetical protein
MHSQILHIHRIAPEFAKQKFMGNCGFAVGYVIALKMSGARHYKQLIAININLRHLVHLSASSTAMFLFVQGNHGLTGFGQGIATA